MPLEIPVKSADRYRYGSSGVITVDNDGRFVPETYRRIPAESGDVTAGQRRPKAKA